MKLVLAFLLLALIAGSRPQKERGYFAVSRIMSRIPDSLTLSTDGIAGYVNANFSTQKEKSRAIFIWITNNISYNFDSIFTIHSYPKPSEIAENILKTRTGVCLHYANLFTVIANKAGIKSYVVQGYTKQNRVVDYLPHVWCAGLIDSTWYLFDPTWGAGYVYNRRFVGQVNNFYYMTKSQNLIHTHMPFDPLWQFLSYPVTVQEFYKGDTRPDKNRPFFNFTDTLRAFENSTLVEQYIASARRIERNGVSNSFTEAKLRVLKGEIEYYRNKANAEKFDTAVIFYNAGITKLNRFIAFRNNQYKPEMDSARVVQMLDSTEYLFNNAAEKIGEIMNPDVNAVGPVIELNNAIRASQKVLHEQSDSYQELSNTNAKRLLNK
ncbi:MAG: hypothetical protein JW830_09970 [Bacteroidales bacterium]|nr:hypothetical protein [Bacteroidales bacterium]